MCYSKLSFRLIRHHTQGLNPTPGGQIAAKLHISSDLANIPLFFIFRVRRIGVFKKPLCRDKNSGLIVQRVPAAVCVVARVPSDCKKNGS